ncbi:hypothetical protein [Yoonia sp. 2307UL14-13]|uniref:hypothetical protein n=1 Tax=Yoonia sp. 2307UL14-13 TaxID=3126506 RepID=UPI0030A48E4A
MSSSQEPDLMRLYLRHCAVGFALSAIFVGLILYFDIARIGSLIAGSDVGYLALFLLWFFNGTIFGSVQFAISIMLNAEDDDEDDGPPGGMLVPIRVSNNGTKSRRL